MTKRVADVLIKTLQAAGAFAAGAEAEFTGNLTACAGSCGPSLTGKWLWRPYRDDVGRVRAFSVRVVVGPDGTLGGRFPERNGQAAPRRETRPFGRNPLREDSLDMNVVLGDRGAYRGLCSQSSPNAQS
jgi:hypothetical protein